MQIIRTKTKDGIHYEGILTGDPATSDSIIIHIHGMAGSPTLNQYYTEMYKDYPAAGWHFLAVTHRGTGVATEFTTDDGATVLGNAYEKFEDCIHDIEAWVNKAAEMGYKRIWLQSHSLGPTKVAYYLSQTKDPRIEGAIFISPSDMVGLIKSGNESENYKAMISEANDLVKQGKGDQLLSQDIWGLEKLSADTYLNFFAEGSNLGVFNYNGPADGWGVVNSLTLPVLAIVGTADVGVVESKNPHEAMKQLEGELKNSPRVKTIVYEGADHSFDGFGGRIVEDVLEFVNQS
ncbi:MAG: alpha/beta hydrolase [Candidatus Dojkabacteria bacterium]|nr:MAG: alpha/beta hydrolase [Candidatus Dojkabacteria bacterium]